MPPKQNEKNNNIQKVPTNDIMKKYSNDSNIFETTYEKVLSIINQVKDFIKKTSKTSQKLIDDLEWVIKVITNKSLYSYEVNKEKISKQNLEYNKFINFVTKYNEEILELNKKHILVSSLFNIGKKGELLLKPSLCLKKILPEELQSMDYQIEKEKKAKKRNSIHAIGNVILNLYYRGLERQKKEKQEKEGIEKEKENEKEKEKELKESDKPEKSEKIIIAKKINKIGQKPKFENLDKTDNHQNNNKKDLKNKGNQIKSGNFSISINNGQKIKQLKRMKTTKNNLNRISLNDTDKKSNFQIKCRLKKKIIDANKYNTTKKENIDSKISLTKQLTLSGIRKAMNDYYKAQVSLIENNNKRKISTQYYNSEKKTDKNKNYSLYSLSRNKTKIKSKELNLEADNKSITSIKSQTKNIEIEKKEERPPLQTLIEKYFDNMKNITDKDFNIFEFKKLVGYKNVLPLLCHTILKTLGLLDPKIIATSKLSSFLYSVSDGYKESTLYHNSLHGTDITQSLFFFFINSNIEEICETTVLDLLGIIISAIGHDLGHPGYNNNFNVNALTDLALTYNDVSCLENYHTSFLFRILKKDENNIFEKLNSQNFKSIRKRMISQILATDMANHGEVISLIRAKIKTCEEEGQKRFNLLSGNEKAKFDEQQMLLNYLIHAADLGHNTRKFDISLKWVELLSEEFWMQGDMERSKGIPISFLCDRNKIDIPGSQIGFLRGFVLTTYDCLVAMFPSLQYTVDNTVDNINEWQKLVDQHRARGWTPKKELSNEKKDKNEK